MKRGLNICCGVLALALLFGGCAQSVPQQEQEPKAEPVAAGAFAAEVEPEYLQHAAYMSAPKGFFGPDQPLRRAEAAQLVCNLAALSPKNLPESGFADVSPEAWYYGAVCAAAAYFEVPEQTPESTIEPEPETADAETSDLPEPEPSYFRPQDAALAYELQAALTRALDLPDTALPAGMTDMTVLTRADAADTSFRTGDVSIMRSARIAPDDQNIAFTGEVDTVPVSSAMLHYIGLNYNNSQFTNAKVRQALSMAISRQGLCATQLQDYADPAVLPINPQPADTGVSYSLSADLMTAAQLLREAAQEGAASAGGSGGNTDSSDGDSDSTDNSDDDSDTSSDSSEEDGYYDEDGDFIYYTSGRASDTDYKVDFLTVRTPKNRTDSTVSDGEVVLLDNENTDSGDSTDSTDGSGSTDTAVTDTIVMDAATVQLSFRLLVNSDNAFKVAAAKQVAASWNSLNGVNVTVDEEPYDTYVSMLQSGSFDAYYGETQLTPDFDLRPLLSPQGGLNYGSYSSEDMSNAITAYRSGENTEGLYTTFLNEMPLIPLAFERQQVVLRSGLINHFNPAPYNAFAGQENWVKP